MPHIQKSRNGSHPTWNPDLKAGPRAPVAPASAAAAAGQVWKDWAQSIYR